MLTYADLLATSHPALVQALLIHANNEALHFILNVVANSLENPAIKYSHQVQKKLNRFREELIQLRSKQISTSKKKKILKTKGHKFIPLIIKQHIKLYRELL